MLVGYEGKNQWRIYDCFKVIVRKDVVFNESKFQYKDSSGPRSEPVGISSTEYINIAELFPPVRKSTSSALDQHLPYHLSVEDKDCDEDTHEPEKSFSTPMALGNPVADALDIVNNLLKETQERNQSELPTSTPSVEDNSLILKGSRSKIWHDYKQANSKDFVKAAKPINKVIEPKTYEEALAGPYTKEWQQVMKEEYDSQIEYGTFKVTTLPYDYKVIFGK